MVYETEEYYDEIVVDSRDCLLVNCSDLTSLFQELGLQCDECHVEEEALASPTNSEARFWKMRSWLI